MKITCLWIQVCLTYDLDGAIETFKRNNGRKNNNYNNLKVNFTLRNLENKTAALL